MWRTLSGAREANAGPASFAPATLIVNAFVTGRTRFVRFNELVGMDTVRALREIVASEPSTPVG